MATLTPSNQVLYGRSYRKQQERFTATVSHWLLVVTSSTTATPHSSPLQLTACPGCSLSKRTPKSSRKDASFSCYVIFDLYRTIRIEPKFACAQSLYRRRFGFPSISSYDSSLPW